MNRLDRISALLVQLQSRPIVTASEMAQRFDVSLRTIYRDMRTLSEAGVPLCGNSGVGYSLVEGYRLPSHIQGGSNGIPHCRKDYRTTYRYAEQQLLSSGNG